MPCKSLPVPAGKRREGGRKGKEKKGRAANDVRWWQKHEKEGKKGKIVLTGSRVPAERR